MTWTSYGSFLAFAIVLVLVPGPDFAVVTRNTLVEDPAGAVFVGLYDITAYDRISLDKWESADTGLYQTITLRVSTLDTDVLAWTYVLNGYEGGLPSARYLGLIAEAAEKAGAPGDYVSELRARPCRSIG